MEEFAYSLYDPRKSLFKNNNEKAKLKIYSCCADYCELKNEKSCLNSSLFKHCPFGKITKKTGFTPRAKNFYKWIKDSLKGVEHLSEIKSVKIKNLFLIKKDSEEYVYFDYPHTNLDKETFLPKKIGFLQSFPQIIPKSQLTPELIAKLFHHRPEALIGGVINSYERDVYPQIILDLYNVFPNILMKAIKLEAGIQQVFDNAYKNKIKPYKVKDIIKKNGIIDIIYKKISGKLCSTSNFYFDYYINQIDATVKCSIKLDPEDEVYLNAD